MAHSNDGSKEKRSSGAGLGVGILGVSLSLVGAACAESSSAEAAITPAGNVRTVDLQEVEVFDATLGAFNVLDREDMHQVQGEEDTYGWVGCRGCRGCGCRGCRGCGCRGCGCRGCGG